MAEVNDMFDEITKEQSYYKAGTKKEITPFAKGEYLGHITKVRYNYTFVVAPENKDKDFTYVGIDGKGVHTKGAAYVGKQFFGTLWRFLEPTEKDTFESNSSGNSSYLRFCETIGVDCPRETKNIDGQEVEIQILPSLSEDDILGKPVTGFVDLGKPWTNREGKKVQYWDCKFCKKWEGGKKLNIAGGKKNDEIPF